MVHDPEKINIRHEMVIFKYRDQNGDLKSTYVTPGTWEEINKLNKEMNK